MAVGWTSSYIQFQRLRLDFEFKRSNLLQDLKFKRKICLTPIQSVIITFNLIIEDHQKKDRNQCCFYFDQAAKFYKGGAFNYSGQPRYLGAELWFTGALLCFEVVGRKFHCLFWPEKCA